MTTWTLDRTNGLLMTPPSVRGTAELNAVVDFDCPFTVRHLDGVDAGIVEVLDYDTAAPDAPDVTNDPDGDVRVDNPHGHRWEALTGWTRQHGYRGAVMHPSEYIGGALARHILDTPGTYVVVEVRDVYAVADDPDDEPIGWAVLRLVQPDHRSDPPSFIRREV